MAGKRPSGRNPKVILPNDDLKAAANHVKRGFGKFNPATCPKRQLTENQTFRALRFTSSFPLSIRNRLEADSMECTTSGNLGSDERRIIQQDRKCFSVQEVREMKAIRAVIAACIFVSGVSILQTCTKSTALHAQDSSPTTHEHLLVQGCVNIPPG